MRLVLVSAIRLGVCALIALFVYLLAVGVTVVGAGTRDNGRQADVIVVMGAAQYDGRPSELLETRLAHALSLWKQSSRAPLIAVTGGKQDGDRFTEAEASTQWLIDQGVEANAILLENKGRSTWESLAELIPILRANSIESVLMVTNDWHCARSALTLEEMGFAVSTSGVKGQASLRLWFRETAGVALGRIIGFRSLFNLTG